MLAADDVAGALPAAFVGEQRVIDDDPELVIGKVDRPRVFVPGSPSVGPDQDDAFDLARLWCSHLTWIEEGAQAARDPYDLALLAADALADARTHNFAGINVVRSGGHGNLAQSTARLRVEKES